MLDHIGISVSDVEKSRDFYLAALKPLNCSLLISRSTPEGHLVCGIGPCQKPSFWIFPGKAEQSGTGVHLCFSAEDRPSVDAFYAAAIQAGGKDNGPPGLRPMYHPNYYGAFVIDPDGNNIEACCHTPPALPVA
eukprot:TRINITY_DN18351_c0_g1_i1.p1 TRINITY_DN18351_c0_g1~~TRINITY_DN18351_c0_g1_i1.p1  ORF type:complete len:134 (+),score=24.23 TRINITY_DN18351_c0_g1_i1:154-555(+)